jgi:hypothetical protein
LGLKGGKVLDINGNTIGEWNLELPEEDENEEDDE